MSPVYLAFACGILIGSAVLLASLWLVPAILEFRAERRALRRRMMPVATLRLVPRDEVRSNKRGRR